jgi:hypothetical protein
MTTRTSQKCLNKRMNCGMDAAHLAWIKQGGPSCQSPKME